MKLGRLLKAASVAFVPLVAGVLFLMVPASAQNNGRRSGYPHVCRCLRLP